MPERGKLIVVSAPSGAGKGTLIKRLLEEVPNVWVSVSATTREPREGERDGVSYFFMTRDKFEESVSEDGFLEYAEYGGNYYGTPRFSVEEHLANGETVILEIDVQGAFQIKEKMPDAAMVFIEPPSMEVLEQRLRARGTDSEESIQRRMQAAEVEMSRKMEYDRRLVNDDLDVAAAEFAAIVRDMANGPTSD